MTRQSFRPAGGHNTPASVRSHMPPEEEHDGYDGEMESRSDRPSSDLSEPDLALLEQQVRFA
ncbi:MAG: hypothetical protein NVS2B16_17250 [Chloroflexota bacterium]